jgi:hypothetical protein
MPYIPYEYVTYFSRLIKISLKSSLLLSHLITQELQLNRILGPELPACHSEVGRFDGLSSPNVHTTVPAVTRAQPPAVNTTVKNYEQRNS